MKTEELKKLIRQVVKEEVEIQVSKAMSKALVEVIREIKSPTPMEEPDDSPIQGAVLKTNNPKLNRVLAETARNYKPLKKTSDSTSLKAMLEGDFEKIGKGETTGVGEPATKIDFLKSIITESAPTPSALDGGQEVPEMLQKVFKKDFRAVMKKIDEKKKTGGSGMISPSQVLIG